MAEEIKADYLKKYEEVKATAEQEQHAEQAAVTLYARFQDAKEELKLDAEASKAKHKRGIRGYVEEHILINIEAYIDSGTDEHLVAARRLSERRRLMMAHADKYTWAAAEYLLKHNVHQYTTKLATPSKSRSSRSRRRRCS